MKNTRTTMNTHTFQTPILEASTNDIIPPVTLVNLLPSIRVVNRFNSYEFQIGNLLLIL